MRCLNENGGAITCHVAAAPHRARAARPRPAAHVLVSKYPDHLPLYRQSQIYSREGVDVDRSTMADWVGRCTALLEPLADEIGRIIRRGDALFADDTPVKMQAPGQKKTKTTRVWTYVRGERPWTGQSPPCAWYQFTIDGKGVHPVNHLNGYKGWVHADGYSGFNGLFGDDKANEMACMAHVRRKFVDVFTAQGSSIAEEAILRIRELYIIEKDIRGRSPEERATVRQAEAKPIFDDLETWLHAQLPRLSGKAPLAQAIRYALGRMPKARPYLGNGHLSLDNNSAERAVKPVALGRKNSHDRLSSLAHSSHRTRAQGMPVLHGGQRQGAEFNSTVVQTLIRGSYSAPVFDTAQRAASI